MQNPKGEAVSPGIAQLAIADVKPKKGRQWMKKKNKCKLRKGGTEKTGEGNNKEAKATSKARKELE